MKPTFKQKFRYFFDNTLARGTSALIMWLSVVTFTMVLVFAIIYTLVNKPFTEDVEFNFFEAFWQSLMRSLDAGTVAGDNLWILRIIGILLTIGGILIVSALIGILSAGLDAMITELRKGKSLVLATNHTLIVGWSQKIIHIIEELVKANENQKNPSIVILADKDKVEMDDYIRENVGNTKNTKIICRTGNPLDINSFRIVNPDEAKSIIVLSPDSATFGENDIYVIKSVLALTYYPNKSKKYHIVAEIQDIENLDAAEAVGKDEVSFVFSQDIVSRITAQTSHQPGLSVIYMDLLCYDGDEMYFKNEHSLIGKTYKDALFAYEKSIVLGIKKSDDTVDINPPMDRIIDNGEEVLAISEDDDTIILSGKTDFAILNESIITKKRTSSNDIEKNIILGWNHKASKIIEELDQYLAEGSYTIICNPEDISEDIEKLKRNVHNQTLTFVQKNYAKRKTLIDLEVTKFDNVMVLCSYEVEQQKADAITILALIHIRNLAEKEGKNLNIISEMHDQNNRQLAEVTQADDFIISQDFISRLLTQISESKGLKYVFDALFSSEGSEIYLKDIKDYVKIGEPVNFYTLLESACLKNETAMGYRIEAKAHSAEDNYGIFVNPLKSTMITFNEDDKIIVLSED